MCPSLRLLLSILAIAAPATTQQVDWVSQVRNKPVIDARQYNFAPRSPNGALSAGVAATATVAPCPLGLNGSDTNHYVYVVGAPGASEAALITGGTCVSGATSGTIRFTPAHSHSAGYTIASATAGCQEAYYSNGGTGTIEIYFPAGNYALYAPCWIGANGTTIRGAGSEASGILVQSTNVSAFRFTNSTEGNGISDIGIGGAGAATTSVGVDTVGLSNFHAEYLRIYGFQFGIKFTGTVLSTARHLLILLLNNDTNQEGIRVDGAANVLSIEDAMVEQVTPCLAGIRIRGSGNTLLANDTFLGCTNGLLIDPVTSTVVASTDIVNTFFDHNVGFGMHLSPDSTSAVVRTRCTQCWASSAGGTGIAFDGAGVIDEFKFMNGEISGNGLNGFAIAAGLVSASNIQIIGNGIFNNTGSGFISSFDGADSITIQGNIIGNDSVGWGGGSPQIVGINANFNNTNQIYTGNTLVGNSGAPINIATQPLTTWLIKDNLGIDDIVPSAVASATAIQAPLNPAFNVSGTTTITTINGFWTGRTIRIFKTDAGSVTIGGGGNVPGSHTLAQNAALTLTWNGSNWY